MVLGIPAGNFFLETSGLWALLVAVPLIILYLIKPKPKEKTIPSLMFFLRDLGSADRKSFFERFTRDWLFWLQLLVLLALALAVAKPYMMVSEKSLAEKTVIVLDVSASMQTDIDGMTRFEKAKELALENIGSVNTVILAKNLPVVGKQEVDAGEAREFIKGLKAGGTSSAIYDSIRTAIDYAQEGTRVVAISDFLETETDSDLNTVKKALLARGAVVDYIQVSSPAGNIGIVDLLVGDERTTVQVRNYYGERRDVTLTIGNVAETLSLNPGEADVVTFSTPKGVATAKLDVNDDFELDNVAHISTPEQTSLNVLVITNDESIESSNLWVALKAIDEKTNYELTLEKAVPPRSIKVDHDIIILKDFDQGKILPGVFRDIQKQVQEKGASLIITAQRGMFSFAPLEPLMPVIYESEVKNGGNFVKVEPEIEALTTDVNFGSADYYFDTRPKSGTRIVAAGENDNASIVAVRQEGAGDIFYYGIFDKDVPVDGSVKRSTFKNNLFYPIFWKRVLDLLTDTPSVDSLNQRTGRVVNLGEGQRVKGPSGEIIEGVFMLENQGIYEFKNRKIATNLLNSRESDVSGRFTETDYKEVDTEEVEREKPKPLTEWFIIGGLILLFLELLYVKIRGDM